MTRGTERHDLVVMALVDRLRAAFRPGGPCRVFAHNRQVKTQRRSYHPDVLVRCGPAADPYYEDDARLIIEVLSPSNKPADRTRMLFDYQELTSVEAILFVDTRRRQVTIHAKEQGTWTERATRDGAFTLGPLTIDFAAMWVEVDEDSTFD
jgi:Uma2 family endonuclease